jgi:hypothetical protein
MAERLSQVLAFAAVPNGAQATLPYRLGVSGTAVLPDFIFVDEPGFEVITVTTTDVTIQNNTGAIGSVNLWLWRMHTIDRAFGDNATISLAPQPFIIVSEGGTGGGGASTDQVFRYTATGAEGTDFNITLPAARATDLYNVLMTSGSVAGIVPANFPDTLAGDRTTTQFRCITAAPLALGDQFDLLVIDR